MPPLFPIPTGLPPSLTLAEPSPGYPVLELGHPVAMARIALHGAHLLDWTPSGAAPVLYVSPAASFQPGKAVRGGIPVCWPWFNAHPSDSSKPQHGIARNRFWSLKHATESPGGVQLRFRLPCDDATRALFPFDFDLTLEMDLGETLALRLITRNIGLNPFPLSEALHTYFATGEASAIRIEGLQGVAYLDTVPRPMVTLTQEGPVEIAAEVDRIYHAAPPVDLVDPTLKRRVRLSSSGSASTVVWNPWIDRAAALADLPDEAYHDFVCMETANAGEDRRTLGPGETHLLEMRVAVSA